VDFPYQRVYVAVAQFLVIDGLAIGAERADAFAERDVDIEPEILTFLEGENFVVFVFE
jgi:hypothetical protein